MAAVGPRSGDLGEQGGAGPQSFCQGENSWVTSWALPLLFPWGTLNTFAFPWDMLNGSVCVWWWWGSRSLN